MLKQFLQKTLKKIPTVPEESSTEEIDKKQSNLNASLKKNLDLFKEIYQYPLNTDIQFREFLLGNRKALLIFIDTITKTDIVEDHILTPLLASEDTNKKIEDSIPVKSIITKTVVKDILIEISKGYIALFIDGEEKAYLFSAPNFEGRNIEKSENETVVKGPKEAFNELSSTNISMIRKKIKSESLVVESSVISQRSNNDVYILYLSDVVNDKMLSNVRERLKKIEVDTVQTLGLLEQRIEERPKSIFPTILFTERPDRAASYIEDGYIVLLMDNSPASLVLPATFWSFYHSSEDHYLRFPYGNFTRMLRLLALFMTLFISAAYVAIVTYHAEMIPPDLLLAIAATREKVPFPAAVEVLMMELAFELIREAGLRVPSPIGPTIGIVGALILGQAAVQANIVSPIVVIVVALGGLSSFAIGDLSMNFAVRMSRFLLLLAASFFGIYGIAALFTVGIFYLVSIKSFGVPYLSPLTPKYVSSKDTIFRRLLQNEFFRPGYVKPKDIKKQ
ncbi:spore germination protein [Ornithinibacillus halophilus]|uniref:Spore germination protein KA n=1 Tax=Ornithinibacillus halophilus TaxID=930117 RepID=A0A1M5IAM4_9BACI|nr:spore germination protein [Ornithinibacillus halophilus]SHG24940.1 spore germination protein KA [Ornithinibacillus halophilus]